MNPELLMCEWRWFRSGAYRWKPQLIPFVGWYVAERKVGGGPWGLFHYSEPLSDTLHEVFLEEFETLDEAGERAEEHLRNYLENDPCLQRCTC